MSRRMRRAIIHAALFFILLFGIIFITSPASASASVSNRTFAWSKIRYQTTASRLPEVRGICPGLEQNLRPLLVMSRVAADGDTLWLEGLAEKYHQCIYEADDPEDSKLEHLSVPANRGHEAMGYLTFIIDNYEKIPAAGAVFVHGSRWAWHNDAKKYDNAALLVALNITSALEPWGYHNLRCDWSLSTCPSSIGPQGSFENSAQAVLEPWDSRAVSDAALPRALAQLFGEEESSLLGRGDTLRSQCCAQFVVSRESLWQHSREEYVALRQWLLDDIEEPNSKAAPRDDKIAGRILSYVWHILFIKHDESSITSGLDLLQLNRQACPRASECYCRLYGRCNLENCKAASCTGEYLLASEIKSRYA